MTMTMTMKNRREVQREYTVIFAPLSRKGDPVKVHVMAPNEQVAWGAGWENMTERGHEYKDFGILRCENGHT